MKIKTLIIVVSLLASSAAFANHQQPIKGLKLSNYTDTFTLSGANVTGLLGQANVRVESVDATHFNLHDKDPNDSSDGTAILDVSNDGTSANSCHLVILDGAYEMNPSIQSVSCKGNLQYTGTQHPYGSDRYTLDFSTK